MADPTGGPNVYQAKVKGLATFMINSGTNTAIFNTLSKMPYNSGNSAAVDKFVDRLSSRVDLLPALNHALAQGNTSDQFVALSKRPDFGNVLDQVAQNPNSFTNIVAQSYSADFGGAPQQPAAKAGTQKAPGQQDTDDTDGDDSNKRQTVAQNQDPKKKTSQQSTAPQTPPPANPAAKPNPPAGYDAGLAADGVSSAQEAKIMMAVIGLVGAMFGAKGGFMASLSDIIGSFQGKGDIQDPGVKTAMSGIMGSIFGGPDDATPGADNKSTVATNQTPTGPSTANKPNVASLRAPSPAPTSAPAATPPASQAASTSKPAVVAAPPPATPKTTTVATNNMPPPPTAVKPGASPNM